MNKNDSIFIIVNGPSMKGFDFNIVNRYATMGMANAIKYNATHCKTKQQSRSYRSDFNP